MASGDEVFTPVKSANKAASSFLESIIGADNLAGAPTLSPTSRLRWLREFSARITMSDDSLAPLQGIIISMMEDVYFHGDALEPSAAYIPPNIFIQLECHNLAGLCG